MKNASWRTGIITVTNGKSAEVSRNDRPQLSPSGHLGVQLRAETAHRHPIKLLLDARRIDEDVAIEIGEPTAIEAEANPDQPCQRSGHNQPTIRHDIGNVDDRCPFRAVRLDARADVFTQGDPFG